MSSVGGGQSVVFEMGDINISEVQGMSVEEVGQEVKRQLDAWTKQQARGLRGRLID
jgi:hypothetical protein